MMSVVGRRTLALPLVAAIVLLAGCSQTDSTEAQGSSATSVVDLAALPSLEATEREMTQEVTDIGQRISQVYPDLQFFWEGETRTSSCSSPYDVTDGHISRMPSYVTQRPNLTNEMWSAIYDIVRESAGKIGLHSNQIFQDQVGIHVIRFTDDTGRAIRLGYQINLTLAPDTGCRLRETEPAG